MQAYCIRCVKCNNRYILGEDAAIATGSALSSRLGRGFGVNLQGADGKQSFPDLVDTCSLSPAEYAQKLGAEVERITSSLSSGVKRYWQCNNCKEVQAYSPIALSVKEFTGANEEEADAAARSAITPDRVIQVSLQPSSKGIFGIGKKPAIARVRYEIEGTDEWVKNHAVDLAAFAWDSYQEKGRGMVLVLAQKAKPWEPWYTRAQFGFLDQAKMEQKSLNKDNIARVREYDPTTEFVVTILRPSSGTVSTARPELPPPQAYEQNKHHYKERLVSM